MSKQKPQSQELTPWQKRYKEERTPKPPDGLSEQARRQFLKIVSKIIFTPIEATPTKGEGLSIDFGNLTREEAFAIGESGTDDWPFLPKDVNDKLSKMQIQRRMGEFRCTFPARDPDHINAIKQARETLREEVLLKLFSEQFKPGRDKGAVSDATKHIFYLAECNRSSSAKELFPISDKSIIGGMSERTFGNHVTDARKKYPKEKKAAK